MNQQFFLSSCRAKLMAFTKNDLKQSLYLYIVVTNHIKQNLPEPIILAHRQDLEKKRPAPQSISNKGGCRNFHDNHNGFKCCQKTGQYIHLRHTLRIFQISSLLFSIYHKNNTSFQCSIGNLSESSVYILT